MARKPRTRCPSLPQEIVDLIVDGIGQDTATLKACSRVSRSWNASAQHRLFRRISLDIKASRTRRKGYPTAYDMLRDRPHIVGYLRELTVGASASQERKQDETRLRTLFGHATRLKKLRLDLSGLAWQCTPTILSAICAGPLASLTVLTLCGVTFKDTGQIKDVLRAPSASGLKHLSLLDVSFERVQDYSDAPPTPRPQTIQLEGFHFLLSEQCYNPVRISYCIDRYHHTSIYVDEDAPWRLSGLKHLTLRSTVRLDRALDLAAKRRLIEAHCAVLRKNGSTLESLSVSIFTFDDTSALLFDVVDPSRLRALHLFTFGMLTMMWVRESLAALPTPNSLKQITLASYDIGDAVDYTRNLASFFDLLGSSPATLDAVHVRISRCVHSRDIKNGVERALSPDPLPSNTKVFVDEIRDFDLGLSCISG